MYCDVFNVQPRFNFSDEIIWSWSDMSPDLTLGISATGRECARVQIRWCYGWRSVVGSAQVWGPSIIGWSHWGDWGGSSRWWCRPKKKSSCSVSEWGTKKGLEFNVACLSVLFFAVKSWNFGGIICVLFTGRGFVFCLLEEVLRTVSVFAWH